MPIMVYRTREFSIWFENLREKDQLQIISRIQLIEDYNHFGDHKNLGDGLIELRWKNGRRIYFIKIESIVVLLLIGGLKNAQKKDINKARLLAERYFNNAT